MKQYRVDKIIRVFEEQLGFTVVNPDADTPAFFLHNKETDDVTSVDRFADKLAEDYVEKAILNDGEVIKLEYFRSLYDNIDAGKKL